MAKQFIREVKPHAKLYRDDRTGIAWIEDGSTGCGHSVHANISASGSVRGMKNLGYWGKKDRTARSHGFIYNIDTYVVDGELDEIVAKECMCDACIERRRNENKKMLSFEEVKKLPYGKGVRFANGKYDYAAMFLTECLYISDNGAFVRPKEKNYGKTWWIEEVI